MRIFLSTYAYLPFYAAKIGDFCTFARKKASHDALSIGKKRYSAVNYYAHKINEPYKREKSDAQNPRNKSGYTSRLEKFCNAVYACKSPPHEKFP